MEKLIYKGKFIKVEYVAYLSGCLRITDSLTHEGDDDIYRDLSGRYYLRRKLECLDSRGAELRASGRVLVHRLSLQAVLLWAVIRTGTGTRSLRRDIAEAFERLAEHDGEFDANAVLPPPRRRGRRHTDRAAISLLAAATPKDEQKGDK